MEHEWTKEKSNRSWFIDWQQGFLNKAPVGHGLINESRKTKVAYLPVTASLMKSALFLDIFVDAISCTRSLQCACFIQGARDRVVSRVPS